MEEARLFGRDLAIVERAAGEDLLDDNAGDLAQAEGAANVVQALRLRLQVRLGELAPLGWPTYGSRLHELIGEPNNARTHVRLMAFARSAVEQDPRVAEVSSVEMQALPGERDVARVVMEVRLVDESSPLRFAFEIDLGAA